MNSIFSHKVLQHRQMRSAELLKDVLPKDCLLLIFAGNPVGKPGGLDQQYFFLPQPEYYWLSGSRRAGGCITFSKDKGWLHFEKSVSRDEIVWEGEQPFCAEYDISDLPAWMSKNHFQKVCVFGTEDFQGISVVDRQVFLEVKNALDIARRPKDKEEILLIEKAAGAAKKAYQKISEFIRAGVTERQIQIEFEAESFRAGSHKTPYESIVGAARRAAVLHAIPTDKILNSGELVLIDAGADIHDYCVDITRVFYADGKPSSQQKNIYSIVQSAQRECIAFARPGVEWLEVHRKAAEVIGQGLIDLGLIRVSLTEALETGVVGLFFPHGVGHMLGQRVRDVGGHLFGRPPRKVFGTSVRVDLPLEEQFLMTFEPGLYFIEALLMDNDHRGKYKNSLNWSELESFWMKFGGVRIEDDVLIVAAGNRNLTEGI